MYNKPIIIITQKWWKSNTSDCLIETPVMLAAFYGLRRSEAVGLRWDAIDFQQNTITIQHTVIACRLNGKYEVIARDTTKTKSSRRTLPLAAPIRKYLLDLQVRQAENRRLCGNCYCKDYEGYICINEMGYLLNPNRVSAMFELTLQQNHLRHIRFHDTRHSCASLLLRNGVSMKDIQAWLGHSDYSTTANLYAHLDVTESVQLSASRLNSGLFGNASDLSELPAGDNDLKETG